MKAYEDFQSRPPVIRGKVRSASERLASLELISENFERGGESVTTKKYKANSYAVRKFSPSVRQGKTWREMSGKPVIPYGSEKRTHGKKENRDSRIEAEKILKRNEKQKVAICFNKNNMKGVAKV